MILIQNINITTFSLGFIFCVFYVLYPFLYSYFKTPDGLVWVPINNQHRHPGDNRIFAAGVQEARLNLFKYKHPCSKEIGNMAIDYFRVTSYRTAALLGFFLPERFAIILSFVFSIILQYSLSYLVSLFIFPDNHSALAASLCVLFWFQSIYYVNRFRGISGFYNHIKNDLLNLYGGALFDRINDNFRYVVMSTSGIFIWLTLALVLNIFQFHEQTLFFIYILYFVLIPFVYPPTTLTSILILVSTIFINSFFKNNFAIFFILVYSGLISLLFLFSTGLFYRIKDLKNSNTEVLNMAHISNKEQQFSIRSFYQLMSGIYFLVAFFSLLIVSFIFHGETFILFIISAVFLLYKLLGFLLRKESLIERFIDRGSLQYLFFAVILTLFLLANKYQINFIQDHMIMDSFTFLAMIIPIIGCFKMAISLQKSNAYYMPKTEWEVYQYIKQKVKPRSTILAFSFSNMQMLPVYTHANLFVRGAEWLENPNQELIKYIRCLKYIGNKEFLLNNINSYFLKNSSYNADTNKKLNEKSLSGYHLINTLLYFPYVRRINNIELTMGNKNEWSQEFVNYVCELIQNDKEEISHENFNYILIDKDEMKHYNIPLLTEKIFSNSRYLLLSRTI